LDSDSRVGRDLAQSLRKYCFDSFFRICHEKGANYTSVEAGGDFSFAMPRIVR
jgi:hypothetical protein